MSKEFILFEDESQRATVTITQKKNEFYKIAREMVSVKTGDVQLHDSFEVHKDELKELARWIIENVE